MGPAGRRVPPSARARLLAATDSRTHFPLWPRTSAQSGTSPSRPGPATPRARSTGRSSQGWPPRAEATLSAMRAAARARPFRGHPARIQANRASGSAFRARDPVVDAHMLGPDAGGALSLGPEPRYLIMDLKGVLRQRPWDARSRGACRRMRSAGGTRPRFSTRVPRSRCRRRTP